MTHPDTLIPRAVVEQALEALERNVQHKYPTEPRKAVELGQASIESLRAALQAQAAAKPYRTQLDDTGSVVVDTWAEADAPPVDPVSAYELGWKTASRWAKRGDLIADIGSPAYIRERDEIMSAQPSRAIEVVARLLRIYEGRRPKDARKIAAEMLHVSDPLCALS